MNPLVEVCVEDVAGAIAAEQAGAVRVELCSNLLEGGLTPSYATIQLARQKTRLPIHILIRPRAGDFCYSPDELEVMLSDIQVCKGLGVQGVVIGALSSDSHIDIAQTLLLIEAAKPLSVTFHRAFDVCHNPEEALEELIALGIDRVLTSGQQASAVEGIPLLRSLRQQAGGRIGILACGGIRAHNVAQVLQETGVWEIHFSAQETHPGPEGIVRLGTHHVTNQALIRQVIEVAQGLTLNARRFTPSP